MATQQQEKNLQDLIDWIEQDPRVYLERPVQVGFNVDHPGFSRDQFWLLFEVGLDQVAVRVLFDWSKRGSEKRDWRLDTSYLMSHADFRDYVESLPRPLTCFGAVEVTDWDED